VGNHENGKEKQPMKRRMDCGPDLKTKADRSVTGILQEMAQRVRANDHEGVGYEARYSSHLADLELMVEMVRAKMERVKEMNPKKEV